MFKIMFEWWNGDLELLFEGTYEECMEMGSKAYEENVLDPDEEAVILFDENGKDIYYFE